jgi:transposase-like protein
VVFDQGYEPASFNLKTVFTQEPGVYHSLTVPILEILQFDFPNGHAFIVRYDAGPHIVIVNATGNGVQFTHAERQKKKREINYQERIKMEKKKEGRRVYSQEFKVEAVALAEKGEKPLSQIAGDLGINENQLYKWRRQMRASEGTEIKPFPGSGKPRDAELTRLRKENKALREANEILKKAAVIFAQGEPR